MESQPASERILSLMSGKLRASYDYIRGRMAQAGLEGLDISHGDILYQLYARGPASMTELAKAIGRDKSTVTALVIKMEARGLVIRKGDPSDARIIVVELTRKGASYKGEFLRISGDLMKALYRGFTAEERDRLASLLDRLGEP